MKHLIRALPLDANDRLTLDRCYKLVKEAHDYLVRQGAEAIEQAREAEGHPFWGSKVKRIRVALAHDDRPLLIPSEIKDHNLVEVINQCATVERLLDTLEWAQTELQGYEVKSCHPTTSSAQEKGKKVAGDNDLILIGPDNQRARFEISDVASDKDGNGKEKKDLLSLGILPRAAEPSTDEAAWLNNRLFLVVSEEFARWLLRPSRRTQQKHYRYAEVKTEGFTRVLEIARK